MRVLFRDGMSKVSCLWQIAEAATQTIFFNICTYFPIDSIGNLFQ